MILLLNSQHMRTNPCICAIYLNGFAPSLTDSQPVSVISKRRIKLLGWTLAEHIWCQHSLFMDLHVRNLHVKNQ